MICQCGAELEGRKQCKTCGRWHVSEIEVERELQATVCLADVEASDVDRIRSGPWDVALGGGMPRSNLILISGVNGSGKSTMMLQLGAAVANLEKKNILYVAKEESAGQIKARAVRLKMSPEIQRRFTIVPHIEKTIGELLEEHDPALVIIDSLPALVGVGTAGLKPGYEVLEVLREYTIRKTTPVIVVDHINKEGDFGGSAAWLHLVDMTLMIERCARGDDLLVIRLGAVKNRNGPTGAYVDFLMTEHGLVEAPAEEEEDDDEE